MEQIDQKVGILYGIIREFLSNKVAFAQRTKGNKTESLMGIWGKKSETVINVPTEDLLGLRIAGLSVLWRKGGEDKRGSFGKAVGIHWIYPPNLYTALIRQTIKLNYVFVHLLHGFLYKTHSPVKHHGLLYKPSYNERGIVFLSYPAKLRLTQKAIVHIHCPG